MSYAPSSSNPKERIEERRNTAKVERIGGAIFATIATGMVIYGGVELIANPDSTLSRQIVANGVLLSVIGAGVVGGAIGMLGAARVNEGRANTEEITLAIEQLMNAQAEIGHNATGLPTAVIETQPNLDGGN